MGILTVGKSLRRKLLMKKSSKKCVVVIGVDVYQLSQAVWDKVRAEGLILYQVNHSNDVGILNIQRTLGFYLVSINLLATTAIRELFEKIEQAEHQIELLIFQPQAPVFINTVDLTEEYINQNWQLTGIGSINIAQAAIKHMLVCHKGTVIFLGSIHAISPSAGWLADSALQAGIRALSQSLAREFQPQGIHIAYVVLDHWSTQSDATAQTIATTCRHVHQQPKSAWSQELSMI